MMRTTRSIAALLVTALATVAWGADAPPAGAGWTGLTNPKDVIQARAELMEHMEELMQPIDTITVTPGPVKNVDQLHFNAEVVGAILTAVPHLFPPTTNLYDPTTTSPQTIALPAIWQNWDSFYRLAQASAKSAGEFAQTNGGPQLRAASRRLRASCDACHTLFLRKYVSPKVQPSDYQFDFNSVLPPKK